MPWIQKVLSELVLVLTAIAYPCSRDVVGCLSEHYVMLSVYELMLSANSRGNSRYGGLSQVVDFVAAIPLPLQKTNMDY